MSDKNLLIGDTTYPHMNSTLEYAHKLETENESLKLRIAEWERMYVTHRAEIDELKAERDRLKSNSVETFDSWIPVSERLPDANRLIRYDDLLAEAEILFCKYFNEENKEQAK